MDIERKKKTHGRTHTHKHARTHRMLQKHIRQSDKYIYKNKAFAALFIDAPSIVAILLHYFICRPLASIFERDHEKIHCLIFVVVG